MAPHEHFSSFSFFSLFFLNSNSLFFYFVVGLFETVTESQHLG